MKAGIISNASYSIPLIQALAHNHIQASVFTDASSSYDTPEQQLIVQYCKAAGIEVMLNEHTALYQWLESTKPDIVFVIGYRHLLDVNRITKQLLPNCYNIHFGSLPAYRGPQPVFWQIRNGAKHLATTIHRINSKFDDGDTIWAKQVRREQHMSNGIAQAMLVQLSLEGVGYILQHIMQKRPLPVLPKDPTTDRYQKRPQLKDVQIDWQHMQAQDIANLVLACNPWNKGAITLYKGREIKVVDAEVNTPTNTALLNCIPGTITSQHNDRLSVCCKDGGLLDITMLNLDGSFVPARHAALFGILQGQAFGR